MHVISVNVGGPKTIFWNNKSYYTSFYKQPVQNALNVTYEGMAGDQQANTKVHGGLDKAVYAYPARHYNYWSEILNRNDLVWGMFGENLTIDGDLNERDIHLGDIFQCGTVKLMAAQPRQPCSKLCMRFDDLTMVKKFLEASRPGIYFRVIEQGTLQLGNKFIKVEENVDSHSILEIYNLLTSKIKDIAIVKSVLKSTLVPQSLRIDLSKLL